jgi:hypothetical protein
MRIAHPQIQLEKWWKSSHAKGTFSLGFGEGRYHALSNLAVKIIKENPHNTICYVSPNQALSAQFNEITVSNLAKIIPQDRAQKLVEEQVQTFTHSALQAKQAKLGKNTALIILDGRSINQILPHIARFQEQNPQVKVIASTELLSTDQVLPATLGVDILKIEMPFDPFDL